MIETLIRGTCESKTGTGASSIHRDSKTRPVVLNLDYLDTLAVPKKVAVRKIAVEGAR